MSGASAGAPMIVARAVREGRATMTPWRALVDIAVIAERTLIGYTRIPEALFFSSVQPVMFVVLFRYVFGGAIATKAPGGYVNFLMPGIFVQTVAFGAVATSIGLAEDLQKGIIERFRSLPMARSGVLAGRTIADLCRNIVVVAIITGVGYAVGFRVLTNVGGYFAGILLLLLFAYALSWGFAVIGLSAPNSETAQVMSFPLLFPLTFASNAFVPVQFMPGWLRGFATYQPVSQTVAAVRALMLGGVTADHVVQTVIWCFSILVVLAPLAVWRYRTRA
ncbi:MAG: ABC transporter permease [Actinomycetota bacterium]|nr:ABC transporter permease [Actinomycetota bacterium]